MPTTGGKPIPISTGDSGAASGSHGDDHGDMKSSAVMTGSTRQPA